MNKITLKKTPDELLEETILKSLQEENIITEECCKNLVGKLSSGSLKASEWEEAFATKKALEDQEENKA